MLHIQTLREGLPLFRALSSEKRIDILETLNRNGPMPMTALSEALGITAGALTPHIKALEACGLVSLEMAVGRHGVQKLCGARSENIFVDLAENMETRTVYEEEISVGQYTAFEIFPTCGIAMSERLIGEVDDPKYFASPERVRAGIIWMGRGYVEYMLPNFLTENQLLLEIQITMELSSEAPGCQEDWPSDIDFTLNGVPLGVWTCPGDFGRTKGIYNPDWWFRNWNQHGLYKLLTINASGTYIDGGLISPVTLGDLNIDHSTPSLKLRLGVREDARHVGGLTIYGRGFGNYNQDIKVRMHYRDRRG